MWFTWALNGVWLSGVSVASFAHTHRFVLFSCDRVGFLFSGGVVRWEWIKKLGGDISFGVITPNRFPGGGVAPPHKVRKIIFRSMHRSKNYFLRLGFKKFYPVKKKYFGRRWMGHCPIPVGGGEPPTPGEGHPHRQDFWDFEREGS